ncbi:FMN-binding protein [Amycolatopsis thailandensis]|uniref:FMN-binding protein n=1 Tax=Amycolatopsis thailandensis TaxID=589330 RepID=UPI00363086BA
MKKTIVALTVALSTAGFVSLYFYEAGPTESTAHAAPAPPRSSVPSVTAQEVPGWSGEPLARAERTIDGTAESNKHGVVQVQLVLSAEDRITDVRFLQEPGPGRGAEAIKVLRQSTLTVQSAAIDTVSGATMTSESYLKSLQAALDAK